MLKMILRCHCLLLQHISSKDPTCFLAVIQRALHLTCILLYLYLCFKNLTRRNKRNSFDLLNGNVFYCSNIAAKLNIVSSARLPRQTRVCSGEMPNSTRVIIVCRLLTKALISLILIQMSNDVESQPGPTVERKGIKLCYWNIQHLTDSKFEEIRHLLTCPDKELFGPDILILSETFCTDKIPETFYSIPGYKVYRKDRAGKSGGGLCAYVKNSIQVERRIDLETKDVEIIWLKICPYKSKRPLFIGGIYRPPSTNAASDKSIGKNIENSFGSRVGTFGRHKH